MWGSSTNSKKKEREREREREKPDLTITIEKPEFSPTNPPKMTTYKKVVMHSIFSHKLKLKFIHHIILISYLTID
jgi:hypothetical protein